MDLLTDLLVTPGGALGGKGGMAIAFIMAAGMICWFSDKDMYVAQGSP